MPKTKYTPTTRPKQSRVRQQISKSVKSSGWFGRKSRVSGQTQLARVRPHEDPATLSKAHSRAVSHATSKKGTLTVAHTEYEGPSLAEKKDWIQGAVNPEHKGYCTPITKETCTPARKALAKRFKKAGRREGTKAGGKTGWKGKV